MSNTADRFLLSIEGVSQPLRVARISGLEGICELFQVDLVFVCEGGGALEVEDVLGKTALLTFQSDDDSQRHLHALVSRLEEGETGKKLTLYRATLVPRVWRLLHRHDCRIFQDITAPDIVKSVLEGAGLVADDFRFALQATYKKREYCVQYRESDWAFVSRLLEDEGIFWYFEHGEDRHVLVLGDNPTVHAPIPGDPAVVFRAETGALAHGEHVRRFHAAGEIRPGKVTLRDYNFLRPSLSLQSEAQGQIDTDLEIYDYPGAYDSPHHGASLVKIRLEERQVHRRVATGESACQRLVPGLTFQLAEHPRETFNRDYLLTRVEWEGFEPTLGEAEAADQDRFAARFQCIPADVPFRPPLVSPRPVVRGVQSAAVVGPSGEEIHTDEHGRVKVQFHWDRVGQRDDHSSCWIRVSQLWAGEGWGAMQIPRVGQEVLVDFLDGDPDRPIVVGRVYHGTNSPPHALPGEKTKSTLKSSSTPGGGGHNELRFEDKKGSEQIHLHAQKDLDIAVENDQAVLIGRDDAQHVKRHRTVTIDENLAETVGKGRTRSVAEDETIEVGGSRAVTVAADLTEDISGNAVVTVGKALTEDIGTDLSQNVGGKVMVAAGARMDLDVTADLGVKVGGAATTEIELEKTLKVGSKITIECGDAKVVIEKNGNITVTGKEISFTADAPVKVDAKKVEVTSSGEVKVEASGKVEIKGSGPMDINASGSVKLKGSNVGIN